MKNKKETKLKHSAYEILKGLSASERARLIGKLFFWTVSYRLSQLPKLKLPTPPRARVHWLGHRSRRRPERVLFSVLLISSTVFFELGEYMIWAVMWGGALSIFVTLNSIYLLVPRRRAHQVK